jgi:hypothetical protein
MDELAVGEETGDGVGGSTGRSATGSAGSFGPAGGDGQSGGVSYGGSIFMTGGSVTSSTPTGGYTGPVGSSLPRSGGTVYLTSPTGGSFGSGGSTIIRTTTGGRGGTSASGGSSTTSRNTGGSRVTGGSSVNGGSRGGTTLTGGSGSGGRSASGGNTGSSNSCPGLDPTEDLIDDMNDGNRFILSNSGRAGAWKDSHDDTPGSTMFPDPVGTFTMTITDDPCRQYAAYVYGGPFVVYGASVWFGLGSPYDASKYKGFTFWAKIDGGTSTGIRVVFPDKDTQPDGNICKTGVTGSSACYDHYGMRVTLGTEWKKYTVPFASLTTDNWGSKGTGFDPSTLYEIQFQIPVNAKFGIWIDDVAFQLR